MSRGCIYTLRDISLKLNLPFEICRWLVEDGGIEVVQEVLAKHHQYLTSRPLLRVLGVAATTIAQAIAVGSQGGPSNL